MLVAKRRLEFQPAGLADYNSVSVLITHYNTDNPMLPTANDIQEAGRDPISRTQPPQGPVNRDKDSSHPKEKKGLMSHPPGHFLPMALCILRVGTGGAWNRVCGSGWVGPGLHWAGAGGWLSPTPPALPFPCSAAHSSAQLSSAQPWLHLLWRLSRNPA